MERGHGCCCWKLVNQWPLAVAVAILILVAAVPLFAQSSGAHQAWQKVANQATEDIKVDPNVRPASHSATPALRLPQLERADREPPVVKVYQVNELLEKLKQEESFPEDRFDGPVKTALVGHLRYFTEELPDPSRALLGAPSAKVTQSRSQFAWHGEQLVVSAPESQHQRLGQEIELRRENGFQQVSVELRMLTGSPDICSHPEPGTTPEEESDLATWRNRWVLFPQEYANLEPKQRLRGAAFAQVDEGAPRRPVIRVSSGRTDPVVYQFLGDSQMRSFMELFEFEDAENTVVIAPKVTVFNGQMAEISDTSQRPFVTDVKEIIGDDTKAYQPVVKVLWEGVKIQVEPKITEDGHLVRCKFTFASIDDCKTFRPPQYADAIGTRIQHPVVSSSEFECHVEIPRDQTLLIGGLFPKKVDRELEQGVVNRMLGRQPETIEGEQVTLIAITPRTIAPQGER